ncbi:MAG: hypothetical protein CR982_10715 [Candidatus Cloacimonadota bacterium]|nr:MAG: hypothetical protein CR982_10715 [Candidatus Cloacimonadota bacterium]
MKHEVSGATLVAIKNSDTNKTFSIAFRTLPEDSTGVAHLTFLNASTAPDKTMYPFSTRNSKEYFNTMDIYLDTVLNPLLKRETFLKEGWHYNVNEDGSLEYSGIVYNEMKGAFSDPFRSLMYEVKKVIFEDTSYQYDSGGDPKDIPNLSYEKFLEFYNKSYHPNNSIIYLYGDEDLKKELAFIDNNFLKNYSLSDKPIEFKSPKDYKGLVKKYSSYSFENQDMKNKTYGALAIRFDSNIDTVTSTALSVIASLLFKSDSSKLKREVLDKGIAEDFNGYYSSNYYNPVIMAYLINSNRESAEKFVDIYNNSIDYYVDNGFDKDILESELNNIYFNIMEDSIDSNRGYVYMLQTIYCINFGSDIFENLDIGKIFKATKRVLNNENNIKELLTKYFRTLDNSVFVIMEPDNTINEKIVAAEKESLKKFREKLTEEEFKNIEEDYKALQSVKPKNNTQIIPRLSKKDLDSIDHSIKLNKKEIESIEFYYTEEFCNSISFLDIGFNIKSIPKRLLPIVDIFSILLGDLGTKNRDYKTLTRDISSYLGSFSHSFQIHSKMQNPKDFKPILWFSLSFLNEFKDKAEDLILDIFENINFSDLERLKETLNKSVVYKEMHLNTDGISHLVYQTKLGTSIQGEYSENINGITSFLYIKSILENFSRKKDDFIADLKELKNLLFRKENLIFSGVTDKGNISSVETVARKIIKAFGSKSKEEAESVNFIPFVNKRSIITSSQVVYNGVGINLYDLGMEYNGSFDVLRQWISRDYLFENIRVKGGAYGAFCRFNEIDGFLGLYTYRDPNLSNSFSVFENMGDTLGDLNITEEAVDRFVIGAYSEYNPLLNPYSRMVSLRDRSLADISDEFIDNKVKEILETKVDDIKSYHEILKDAISKGSRVTMGNRDIIEKSNFKFDDSITI